MFVGKTTLASTQQLRKHANTTAAGTEDPSFHDLLRNTTDLHWTLVPVEVVDGVELGCYRERSWWHTMHRCPRSAMPKPVHPLRSHGTQLLVQGNHYFQITSPDTLPLNRVYTVVH